jgi:hypothetical protein
MTRRSNGGRTNAQDIAAEIIRRAAGDGEAGCMTAYVLRLAQPPTFQERLQLMAARLQRRPIVVMAHKCASVEEWLGRYSYLKDC